MLNEEYQGPLTPGMPRLGLLKKPKKLAGKKSSVSDSVLGQKAAARGTLSPGAITPTLATRSTA
jgi:hypothetical protein